MGGIMFIGFIILSISIGCKAGAFYGWLTFGISLLITALVGAVTSMFNEDNDDDWKKRTI